MVWMVRMDRKEEERREKKKKRKENMFYQWLVRECLNERCFV